MHTTINNSPVQESLPIEWINWCRLCAKEDDKNNINFLYQDEEHLENENKKLSIQEALAKYFWVQCSLEDSLPKMLCNDCLSLVSSLINFNQRVERVQQFYIHLTKMLPENNFLDLQTIRLKFDVTEQERDHWFSKYLAPEINCMDTKSNLLVTEENKIQTGCDTKLATVMIKQEKGEKLLAMEYDEYLEEDTQLDKEEMLYDDNINDSYQEDDEDPFNNTSGEEYGGGKEEESSSLKSIKLEEPELQKCKPDRSKKKKKRKKLKQFPHMECNKRKNAIKDFKIEVTCKECGDNFTKYILYRQHMQHEHDHNMNDKHWPCPSCDKVLLSLYNLERHVRIHVPLEVRQTIKCTECDNRYTSNAQLETHIRYKHKNEKPFICEECGLCLRTNSNLRQHMLIHTDIAPFECEVCKKKFKNNTRLKTHMDIHSPNKHICNICGLQLNSRATLNRHFLVHSDEMQHKCDYCGKAFKRAKALKNHLLLHTGLKPYSCDFCDRTFANGSNCRSHMKKMHPEELAVLEASGNKTHTKNIPKLETLKAVTKAADNLTPVVTKFSGCFAFGKKPKILDNDEAKQQPRSAQKQKKQSLPTIANDKLTVTSPSSTPLDLQYTPLVGNNSTPTCPSATDNHENDLSSTATTHTAIPNFDNIYQHLMKQNQNDLQLKRPLLQISPHPSARNIGALTPHNNTFYQHHTNIIDHSLKPSQVSEDLLRSPESQHSSMTPLTQDDQSNASSIQGAFYEPIRPTLPPGNFM